MQKRRVPEAEVVSNAAAINLLIPLPPAIAFLCDVIDNAGAVITVDVNVTQKKFTSAKFYINEVIYGDVDGSAYLADAYLAGIGVG